MTISLNPRKQLHPKFRTLNYFQFCDGYIRSDEIGLGVDVLDRQYAINFLSKKGLLSSYQVSTFWDRL